jgi:hypothetical protein
LVTHGNRRTVYASWNGDTRTVSWQLLGVTDAASAPKVLATAQGGVFEVHFTVPANAKQLRVQALDAGGKVLGAAGVS